MGAAKSPFFLLYLKIAWSLDLDKKKGNTGVIFFCVFTG